MCVCVPRVASVDIISYIDRVLAASDYYWHWWMLVITFVVHFVLYGVFGLTNYRTDRTSAAQGLKYNFQGWETVGTPSSFPGPRSVPEPMFH